MVVQRMGTIVVDVTHTLSPTRMGKETGCWSETCHGSKFISSRHCVVITKLFNNFIKLDYEPNDESEFHLQGLCQVGETAQDTGVTDCKLSYQY